MKRINIYLTKQEENELRKIRKIHHLSFSSIIDIIANQYFTFKPYADDINFYSQLEKLTVGRRKTTIKTKNIYGLKERQINNALYYYIYNRDKTCPNMPQKERDYMFKHIRSQINKQFQTTIDEWSNYNQFCRMKERYERENKRTEIPAQI